jgi:hypothetical protein
MLAATHKPGAIALRPLQLGDIYDAAFRIIRFNPRATVGAAVLVSSIAMLLPVLVTAILTRTEDMTIDSTGGLTGSDVAPILGSVGSSLLGFLLQSLGLVLVTGMVAHVTMAAAIGRKLTFAEAFAATKGKRGKLFGLVALLLLMTVLLVALLVVAVIAVVVGIGGLAGALLIVLLIPVFSLALFWFWIRIYYLPVPALMLEEVGVFGAIERAHALTARAFWRVFGIALLTWFITSVAGGLLGLPLTAAVQSLLGAGLDGQYAALAVTVVNALVSVVQAAFVAPFTAAVTSLQYIDQRIRKEAFDVELMTRAGIMAS